jgi:hypothetical protein
MADAKWTVALWTTQTPAEMWEGVEKVTQPPATALLTQAGLIGPGSTISDGEGVKLLDNGAGRAQLSEMLFQAAGKGWKGEVVLGNIDDSFMTFTKEKVIHEGWENAKVERLDAMACVQVETARV